MFFFIIYAIAGLNLFSGFLKYRCVIKSHGIVHLNDLLICGNKLCPNDYFCGKQIYNPNWGYTSFDNFFASLFQVFQCMTLEGWTEIASMMGKGFSTFSYIYFLTAVIFGSYFILGITLAVIKVKFTETHSKITEIIKGNRKNLKQKGIYKIMFKELKNNPRFFKKNIENEISIYSSLSSFNLISPNFSQKLEHPIFFQNDLEHIYSVKNIHKIDLQDIEIDERDDIKIPYIFENKKDIRIVDKFGRNPKKGSSTTISRKNNESNDSLLANNSSFKFLDNIFKWPESDKNYSSSSNSSESSESLNEISNNEILSQKDLKKNHTYFFKNQHANRINRKFMTSKKITLETWKESKIEKKKMKFLKDMTKDLIKLEIDHEIVIESSSLKDVMIQT